MFATEPPSEGKMKNEIRWKKKGSMVEILHNIVAIKQIYFWHEMVSEILGTRY